MNIRQAGHQLPGFQPDLAQVVSPGPRAICTPNPARKAGAALREKLGDILNHRTLWRPIQEVVAEANHVLRGWAGYFHFGNSVTVMKRMNSYSQNRLRRWLWRKHGCCRALWKHYPTERLHTHYGLYEMPLTAKWKAAR